MLQRLVAFSLSQRLIVLVLAVLVGGLGLYSYLNLPVDAFPDISPTQVKIILKAPGMTPEEVENAIKNVMEMGSARAIVMDLRGNTGGLFAAAVKTAEKFLPAQTPKLPESRPKALRNSLPVQTVLTNSKTYTKV